MTIRNSEGFYSKAIFIFIIKYDSMSSDQMKSQELFEDKMEKINIEKILK